jgi:uncharacterized protein (TIGR03083 family)
MPDRTGAIHGQGKTDMITIALPDVATYGECRRQVLSLVDGVDEAAAGTPVRACPGWSVHDVISHLTGIADDVLAGRMAGLGSPAWTAAQVEARRGKPLEAVCSEWLQLSERFEQLLEDQPELALAAAADAVIHEHDIRHALGQPGDPNSAGIRATARRYAELFAKRTSEAGRGEVGVSTTEGDTLVEVSQPVITVEGPAFDLLLALTGRCSKDDVLALRWSRDPSDVLAYMTPYGPYPAKRNG